MENQSPHGYFASELMMAETSCPITARAWMAFAVSMGSRALGTKGAKSAPNYTDFGDKTGSGTR
jgi:hypothetical protein